jgi:hypothetical protein
LAVTGTRRIRLKNRGFTFPRTYDIVIEAAKRAAVSSVGYE